MLPDRHTLHALEGLFRQGHLSRRQLIAGLAALGASSTAIDYLLGAGTSESSAPVPARATHLVVIVLDAFRADYLSLHPMPELTALIRSGTSYDRAWVGQLESYTPVGHASISTGALPRTQGVIGFEWEDARTGVRHNDGWASGVLAGDLDRDLHRSGASSIPLAVKAADPRARVVALSSEKVYAADAMGGWSGDYTLYLRAAPNGRLTLGGVPGHSPPPDFLSRTHLTVSARRRHFSEWDELSGVMALAAVEHLRPRVLMVNLPGTDVYGHVYGGPATPAVMRRVIAGQDRTIGRIVRAYKDAGIFDQTLFVVTADHGMVPNDWEVTESMLRDAVRKAGGSYFFHTGGTGGDIYLHDLRQARRASGQINQIAGVAAAYYLARHGGRYEYLPAPGLRIDSSLDAAFRYLLGTFVGPTAPAIMAPYRENTIGQPYTTMRGDHGGASWGVQHIPLVMAGPGVRRGRMSHYPARLVDVAPTVLALMGLTVPKRMDGIVLADAVAGAPAADVAAQGAGAGALIAHQNALIRQSADNMAQDRKSGRRPPPNPSVHP